MRRRGLNLIAVLDCSDLPADIAEPMLAGGVALADYPRLLLLGSGGKRFWRALPDYAWKDTDPVDHYSAATLQAFIADYLGSAPSLALYPGDMPVPLQRLGALAGWQQPSPLGVGIHPHYGLWFAYRAAALLDSDLPLRSAERLPAPCESCSTKPCISACPARAVGVSFALDACMEFRLSEDSICAEQCLSRLACPVGRQHRYSQPQLRYHYARSLASLQRYRACRNVAQ